MSARFLRIAIGAGADRLRPLFLASPRAGGAGHRPTPPPKTATGRTTIHTGRHERDALLSPSIRINGSNFNQLEVAWRFKTRQTSARRPGSTSSKVTPLAIKGILYIPLHTPAGNTPSRRRARRKTGEGDLDHSLREGKRRDAAVCRVLSPPKLSGPAGSRITGPTARATISRDLCHDRLFSSSSSTHQDRRDDSQRSAKAASLDLKVGAVFGKGQQNRSRDRGNRRPFRRRPWSRTC